MTISQGLGVSGIELNPFTGTAAIIVLPAHCVLFLYHMIKLIILRNSMGCYNKIFPLGSTWFELMSSSSQASFNAEQPSSRKG